MQTFTAVQYEQFSQAFALAHKLSEQPDIPARERKYFRAIAHLLWKARGADPLRCTECGSTGQSVHDDARELGIQDPICCQVEVLRG